MKNKLKYYRVVFEGIDKTGKDTIARYMFYIDGGKYLHISRGMLSVLSYNLLYNRNFDYDLSQEKNTVYVYLDVNEEDWKIRCKMTNEPSIDFNKNKDVFNKCMEKLQSIGSIIWYYDTSKETAYEIAKDVFERMEKLNGEDYYEM